MVENWRCFHPWQFYKATIEAIPPSRPSISKEDHGEVLGYGLVPPAHVLVRVGIMHPT